MRISQINFMKKSLLAIIALCVTFTICNARDIYVYNSSNATIKTLKNATRITFADGQMQVKLSDGTIDATSLSDMKFFAFYEKIPTAIKSLKGNKEGVSFDGNTILVNKAESIAIYNATGALISSQKSNQDGKFCISTSDLPSGVYIIQTTNQGKTLSHKFIK